MQNSIQLLHTFINITMRTKCIGNQHIATVIKTHGSESHGQEIKTHGSELRGQEKRDDNQESFYT